MKIPLFFFDLHKKEDRIDPNPACRSMMIPKLDKDKISTTSTSYTVSLSSMLSSSSNSDSDSDPSVSHNNKGDHYRRKELDDVMDWELEVDIPMNWELQVDMMEY